MTATASKKHQTDTLHGPNLILDVENFGPITEAKNIEFKPMTVFVGPSNTGKTYLASMLHIWLKSVHTNSTLSAEFSNRSGTYQNTLDATQFETFRSELLDVATDLAQLFAQISPGEFYYYTFEMSSFSEHFKAAKNVFQSLVYEYFSINLESNSYSNHADIDMPVIILRNNVGSFDITLTDQGASYNIKEFAITMDIIDEWQSNPEILESDSEQSNKIVNLFFDNLIGSILDPFRSSFYLPTGRSGIINSRHVLASELVARNRNYNLIARDFLSLIVRIRSNPARPIFRSPQFYPRKNPFVSNVRLDAAAHAIEKSVLKGQVVVKDTTGLSEFYFQRQDNSVPMEIASSMVTDLAPVVLFLRNFIQVGDLLIIDEPEAHLHPAAQQQMAAALAFMVRSGLRVLITTHSHYMVEQLSAFVNASKLDETTRKRALSLGGALGKEDIYLNEEETAVYNFRFSPEHGGSVVEEVFMGDEYEYGTDDHSDATVDQFNRLQRVLEAREAAESNGVD